MEESVLDEGQLDRFRRHLVEEERSANTIQKYLRDVRALFAFYPEERALSKEMVLAYKRMLSETYKATSMNSMLVALNRFFRFCGREDLRVKLAKVQRAAFREQSRELTRDEYRRLVCTAQAKKKERLHLLLQTMGSTGIRASEHRRGRASSVAWTSRRFSKQGGRRVRMRP